ncbi:MAG: DsbA family protein [Candidatus Omnitrophica bacterium]|nr:DsbA family protein [Candidatus Omnitrophota bacterium]
MKVEINDNFVKGFLAGTLFVLILVFLIQGWDFFRYTWFTEKIERLAAQQPAVQGAVKAGARPSPTIPPAPPPIVNFQDLTGKPSQGPEKAAVTLVEFSDFHCPFCKRLSPIIDEIMKNYSGKVRRVWRHFPLPMHVGADKTHEASGCAAEQGKFWDFHQVIFSMDQPPQGEAALAEIAKKIKLDEKKFSDCLKSGRHKAEVEKDIAAGNKAGVRGTPTLFVNGKLLSGAQPYEAISQVVQAELSTKK